MVIEYICTYLFILWSQCSVSQLCHAYLIISLASISSVFTIFLQYSFMNSEDKLFQDGMTHDKTVGCICAIHVLYCIYCIVLYCIVFYCI